MYKSIEKESCTILGTIITYITTRIYGNVLSAIGSLLIVDQFMNAMITACDLINLCYNILLSAYASKSEDEFQRFLFLITCSIYICSYLC